jgi:hypothetical protein
MSLQVIRSEELRVSKAAGPPYERNARTNVQRRSVAKAMINRCGVESSPPTDERSHFILPMFRKECSREPEIAGSVSRSTYQVRV